MKIYYVEIRGRHNQLVLYYKDRLMREECVSAHNLKEAKQIVWKNLVDTELASAISYSEVSRYNFIIEVEDVTGFYEEGIMFANGKFVN